MIHGDDWNFKEMEKLKRLRCSKKLIKINRNSTLKNISVPTKEKLFNDIINNNRQSYLKS